MPIFEIITPLYKITRPSTCDKYNNPIKWTVTIVTAITEDTMFNYNYTQL